MTSTAPVPVADLTTADLDRRLGALVDDLAGFPAGAICPWPVAAVFNALLSQVVASVPADPVLGAMVPLAEPPDEESPTEEEARLVGTVRVLVGQLRCAMGAAREAAA